MGAYSHNLKSFIHAKPPLVIFLLCVLFFSVTTLCLAIYIQNNPRVKNTDVLDWNRLVKELGELEFCLCEKECVCQKSVHTEPVVGRRKREMQLNLNKAEINNSSKIVVTEKLPIKTKLVKELGLSTSFRGVATVPLDHFGLGHDASATVQVTLQQEQGEQDMVCVAVEGDEEHVHGLLNKTVGSASCGTPPAETADLCVHSSSHIPHSWCADGKRFDLDFDELPQYITYLTVQLITMVLVDHLMSGFTARRCSMRRVMILTRGELGRLEQDWTLIHASLPWTRTNHLQTHVRAHRSRAFLPMFCQIFRIRIDGSDS